MTYAARAATLDRSAQAAEGGSGLVRPRLVDIPEDPAVRVAFTGRVPGNLSLLVGEGDVARARGEATDLIGGSLSRTVFMQQVHGGDVARVGEREAGRGATAAADAFPAVDGLVTTARDLTLAVLVADCVPVILVDPGRGVAAVHAGRGGVQQGVVPAAVRALAPGGAQDVVAVIGPAIGGCCYEVPEAMAEPLIATTPAAAATTRWGTTALDLPAAVTAQLQSAGVARVERAGACTRCNDDVWFSHRSATAGRTEAGRQAGLVRRAADGVASQSSTGSSLHSS